jgi:hypothetical protein
MFFAKKILLHSIYISPTIALKFCQILKVINFVPVTEILHFFAKFCLPQKALKIADALFHLSLRPKICSYLIFHQLKTILM